MVQYSLISKRPCTLQYCAVRLICDGGKRFLLRHGKRRLNLIVERALILLES
jgi:hypothetical protein